VFFVAEWIEYLLCLLNLFVAIVLVPASLGWVENRKSPHTAETPQALLPETSRKAKQKAKSLAKKVPM